MQNTPDSVRAAVPALAHLDDETLAEIIRRAETKAYLQGGFVAPIPTVWALDRRVTYWGAVRTDENGTIDELLPFGAPSLSELIMLVSK